MTAFDPKFGPEMYERPQTSRTRLREHAAEDQGSYWHARRSAYDIFGDRMGRDPYLICRPLVCLVLQAAKRWIIAFAARADHLFDIIAGAILTNR